MREPSLTTSLASALSDVQLEHSLTRPPEDVSLYVPTNHSCTLKIPAKVASPNAQLIYTDKIRQELVFQIVPMVLSLCRKVAYASLFVQWDSMHIFQLNFVSKPVRSPSTEIPQLELAFLPAPSTSCSMPITRREHVLQNALVAVTPTSGQWPACRAVRSQCRLSFRPTLPATTTPAPSSALSPSTHTTSPSAAYRPAPIPTSTISRTINAIPVQAPAARAPGLLPAGPASRGFSCRTVPVFRIALFFTTPTRQLETACFPLPAGLTLVKTLRAPVCRHAR